ncbi:acyl-CoA dehydrogenase family protein [Chloroflexota bacterium]
MDFSLSEQEKMLQKMAREFATKVVAPQAAGIDSSAEFPHDLAKELGKQGYLGLPYPTEYGGGGAGYLSYTLVLEQICQAQATVGAIMSVNTLAQEAIFRFGSETQKQTYLTPSTQGRLITCFAFTDPETGSDPKAFTTIARKSDAGYIVNGQKQFVALAPAAGLAIVFARREAGDDLNAFIVSTSAPGFELHQPGETMGLRGLGISVAYLNEVCVPRENRLGKEGQGFDILLEAISVGRLGVATQAVGIAQAALELATGYARQRRALGQPISKMPSIQWHLAEMAAGIEAARWQVYRTASHRDQGLSIRYESAIAKLFASQQAVAATSRAMQVAGAYGAMKSLPLERLYRDAKMTEIYEGVSEIQRSIIARYLIERP